MVNTVDKGRIMAKFVLAMFKSDGTRRDFPLTKDRVIIGRSEHNDLQIDSKFISRNHALLIRNGNTTFLMDLNSTNGTFVNSRRVSNQVLMDNDIITLGSHRIKFRFPLAKTRTPVGETDFADTVIMKSVEDMRRMLARENTQAMPVPDLQKISGGKDS